MRRTLAAALSVLALISLTGCAAVLLGAGAGVGTYAYVKGELIRTYQKEYETTLSACESVIDDMGMSVQSKSTDGVQTTIKATRKDEIPVTVKVKIAGPDWTQVSVRTGFVGVWRRELSEQFHEHVAKRLD